MGATSLLFERRGLSSRQMDKPMTVERTSPVREEIRSLLLRMRENVSEVIQVTLQNGWEAIRPLEDGGFVLLRSNEVAGIEVSALRTPHILSEAIKVFCDEQGNPVEAAYLHENQFYPVKLCKNCGEYQARILLQKLRTFKGCDQFTC